MNEETTKYQTEWQSFQDRSAHGCLLGIIFVGIAIALRALNASYPALVKFFTVVIAAIILGGLVFFTVKRFRCPRCLDYFDHFRARQVRYCINCGLPKFYGSRWYYDLWGTENGKLMAEQIRLGKL